MESTRPMGWHRELPDLRDHTQDHPAAHALYKRLRGKRTGAPAARVDLRQWCSPIEDQGRLGSCTAHAAVGMLEFYERLVHGTHVDASRLFVYAATRRLLGWTGDAGGELRAAMHAIALWGAPPEALWPYVETRFDQVPDGLVCAAGAAYRGTLYYRLDPAGTLPTVVLARVKERLAARCPAMFGFTVYSNLEGGPLVPLPTRGARVAGGHAVLAVGYDDAYAVPGAAPGALLIRNSWGAGWGDGGYGWLPYDYVLRGLAVDWWSLARAEYLDAAAFA